jgi:Flp pilus assembly protein TadD
MTSRSLSARSVGLLGSLVVLVLPGCSSLGGNSSLEYRQKMEAQRAMAETEAEERPARPISIEDRLAEGDRFAAGGERARSLWQYLEAHKLDPSHPEPVIRLGFFYLVDDPEQAAALFARGIEVSPENARAHAGLGLVRLSQLRLGEARTSLERAVALEPGFPTAQDALAVVLGLQDEHEEGLERAQEAHRLSPKDGRIVNNLGVSLLAEARWSDAEQAFRTAILLDPSDLAYYNNLGLALGRQGRFEEALGAFRQNDDEQAVHNNLGYVYYLSGDLEMAIQQYEQALTFQGSDRIQVLRNLRAATEVAGAGQ